jgi:hypothetical protein
LHGGKIEKLAGFLYIKGTKKRRIMKKPLILLVLLALLCIVFCKGWKAYMQPTRATEEAMQDSKYIDSLLLVHNGNVLRHGGMTFRDYSAQDFQLDKLDIKVNPLTLNDCYISFDSILESETKDVIKKTPVHELIKYHLTFGRWVRNRFLYRTDSKITKLFHDKDEEMDIDDISHIIIIGYHYYLNGNEKTLEELMEHRMDSRKELMRITKEARKKN